MTIYNLRVGQTAVVRDILCDDKLKKRLLALGCTSGTEVTVKRMAPLGDPLIISFRGSDLAIRKKDAKNIQLTV